MLVKNPKKITLNDAKLLDENVQYWNFNWNYFLITSSVLYVFKDEISLKRKFKWEDVEYFAKLPAVAWYNISTFFFDNDDRNYYLEIKLWEMVISEIYEDDFSFRKIKKL